MQLLSYFISFGLNGPVAARRLARIENAWSGVFFVDSVNVWKKKAKWHGRRRVDCHGWCLTGNLFIAAT